MKLEFEEIVEQIITVSSREEFGNDFAATKSLKHTKSSLQATLLREFPDDAY
ncbi:hypothetical protein [Vibrio ostreae]|uniref:Uncharacterized protein n=1 Tax=Vibrio ostreae TaxID=2841925 RepID=A0A975YPQ5_9VIBR|nr:hypothetical protein [Vibrio ostreae]QXO19038.1 hypothetical protein KNV97_12610 [Vibrio ostreae]